ncbi:MAG: SNF2-related protein [bacterium]
MTNYVFIVRCERIYRKSSYHVTFLPNDQLKDRIKKLEKKERKWDSTVMAWEITPYGLYKLIKQYKGSKKIRFDFGSDEARRKFAEKIQKILKKEQEKKRKLEELKILKEEWLEYKNQLDNNYKDHIDVTHKNLKEGIKLFPHQVSAAMFTNKVRNVLISHEMGLGKANPIDSNILTPNGWVKMGNIKVGDKVIGSDGKPKRVLGVYPQGKKDIYEITFNDKTTAQSCDEHLWNVNSYIRNWRKNSYQTKTLREIIDSGLKFKNGNNKWYIPIIKPVEFDEKKLLINPYILGAILGDGSITTKSNIGFSSIDKPLINETQNKLPEKHNLVPNGKSKKDYYLTSDGKLNLINRELKRLNLKGCNSHTKFIPDEYKFSSIEQRIEILRGLLDTDGHSRIDGIIEITLASKQLIEDIQFIVQSLGGIGRLHNKNIIYKGKQKSYYRLNIKLPPYIIPFKLSRKIETFKPPSKYLPNRSIVDIKYVGKKEAQCIYIDSDDHLYAMDNCILTHNTLSSIAYVEMNNFEKVFVITPNSLKYNFYNEVLKFTNSKPHIVNWRKNKYSIEESKYIIVNYEFFNPSNKRKFEAKWKKLNINIIDAFIADECQMLKNTSTNTYKNIKSTFTEKIFRDEKVSRVFLSGTPAPNRAHELYSVLNLISPLDFKTKEYFYEYYCGLKYDYIDGWGYVKNEENTKYEELFHKIAPYTHRKRKKEVLKDLPDKTYQRIMVDFTSKEQKIYDDIEKGVVNEFVNEVVEHPLTRMLRLQQFTTSVKVKHVKEIIDNLLDTGTKVVVIDQFKESLRELHQIYGDIVGVHDGDISPEKRNEIVEDFQNPNGKIKIFAGTIATCNYGLTLTASSVMFILTQPFSVGKYDQVSDRCILKGELVLTKNGYIPIENITIGDYVYTHKGNWKKVLYNTNKIERNKSFFDIKYKGFFKPLRCTEDHKIYVYDYKKGVFNWVEANQLNIMNHGMVFPNVNINNYNNEFAVKEHKSKKYNKININLKPQLTNELLYGFGRYVGDGHINDHQVSICGHIDEYDEVLNSIMSIKKEFNVSNHFEYCRDNKVEMYISSIELRNNFKVWFGEGAYNKKIPDFIYHLKTDQIRSFLNGYYGADGHTRKNTQQASTVSSYLSYQIIQLEGLFGNSPSLVFNKHAKCWSIEYSIKEKIKRKTLVKNINGYSVYPIQEIKNYKPKRNDERVYDLTIEDDESFIVGLSSVHNCHRIGQKDAVNIYPILFPNTIDEYVFETVENKRSEITAVMDNEKYESNIDDSILGDVIEKMKNKYRK